jgi:hypothetical protein
MRSLQVICVGCWFIHFFLKVLNDSWFNNPKRAASEAQESSCTISTMALLNILVCNHTSQRHASSSISHVHHTSQWHTSSCISHAHHTSQWHTSSCISHVLIPLNGILLHASVMHSYLSTAYFFKHQPCTSYLSMAYFFMHQSCTSYVSMVYYLKYQPCSYQRVLMVYIDSQAWWGVVRFAKWEWASPWSEALEFLLIET